MNWSVRLLFGIALVSGCQRDNEHAQARRDPAPTASTSTGPVASAQSNIAADLAYSRGLVKQFGSALKQALMRGMTVDGPQGAIEVCRQEAPEIANSLKIDDGWSIRRTSLKLRNPDNKPDAWERRMLERFEADKTGGAKVESMEASEVVESGEMREFRYMKAIETVGLCLACHGQVIDDEVAAALNSQYPTDQARGFSAGDIRGAFSIRKQL